MNVDCHRPDTVELVRVELHFCFEYVSWLGYNRSEYAGGDTAGKMKRGGVWGVEQFLWDQHFALCVEHQVQSRERRISEQGRYKATCHTLDAFSLIDFTQRRADALVAIDATFVPVHINITDKNTMIGRFRRVITLFSLR